MPIELSALDKFKTIIFGPFIGQLQWELLNWCGFIRWYKLNNPDKTIIVSTRQDRADLYTDVVDDLVLFNIDKDYIEKSPNGYDCFGFSIDSYNQLKNHLLHTYKKSFIFEPKLYQNNENIFSKKEMNFEFKPNKVNKQIIHNILEKNKDRIPITFCTRNRNDSPYKNWGSARWRYLFEPIERSGRFICFVSGIQGSYYTSQNPNFYNLDDYSNSEINTTPIGLSIEAMKSSRLTVGANCSGIILSNLLGIETLTWGHINTKYFVDYNPKRTKCTCLDDRLYKMDHTVIWNFIKKLKK